MSYIKKFIEQNNVITNDYGKLKYEVNQDDKTIIMDKSTKSILEDVLVVDKSDFSYLTDGIYILFYNDENEQEIFDVLSYRQKKWKYNEGGIIAKTILQQLGGFGKLKAMVGAYNFIDTGKGLSFRIKNQRANYIKVTLNSLDLYDLEIGRIRGIDYKIVFEQKNLYADQLKPIIEKVTGMYLSFADGGEISKSNNEMLKSQVKAVKHHAKELSDIVTDKTPVEAWVVGKVERASTDLSDITHYLDGLKYEKGGELLQNEDYKIIEGYDSFKDRPLYKVVAKKEDNDYIGEWHTDIKDAEEEYKDLCKECGGEMYAKGGYISSEEYRDKLEAMTDNELLAAYCDEYGFDIEEDDHKERIEEERDMVIDDMVERYQRYMKSTGRMAKGGKVVFVPITPKWGEEKKGTEFIEVNKDVYAKGGKVSFKDKVKAISSRLEGTKVKPKYQRLYGRTYDKMESIEAATKIAGKQVAKSKSI